MNKLLLIPLLIGCFAASAQRTIKGNVKDENGQSAKGILIKSLATKMSVAADVTGNFILNAAMVDSLEITDAAGGVMYFKIDEHTALPLIISLNVSKAL